jgi:hypothetical protein
MTKRTVVRLLSAAVTAVCILSLCSCSKTTEKTTAKTNSTVTAAVSDAPTADSSSGSIQQIYEKHKKTADDGTVWYDWSAESYGMTLESMEQQIKEYTQKCDEIYDSSITLTQTEEYAVRSSDIFCSAGKDTWDDLSAQIINRLDKYFLRIYYGQDVSYRVIFREYGTKGTGNYQIKAMIVPVTHF